MGGAGMSRRKGEAYIGGHTIINTYGSGSPRSGVRRVSKLAQEAGRRGMRFQYIAELLKCVAEGEQLPRPNSKWIAREIERYEGVVRWLQRWHEGNADVLINTLSAVELKRRELEKLKDIKEPKSFDTDLKQKAPRPASAATTSRAGRIRAMRTADGTL